MVVPPMIAVSRARSSMTEFQLPSAAVDQLRGDMSPEEVRDGLMYEVHLVMQGIHFVLVAVVLASILCVQSDTLTAVCIVIYVSWFLLQSGWGRGNRKSRQIVSSLFRPQFWLNCCFVLVLTLTAPPRSPRFDQFLVFSSVMNTIWSLNFHPYFQVLIQAPLQDVQVKTGLLALAFMYLVRAQIRLDYTDHLGNADSSFVGAFLPLTGFAILTRFMLFLIFTLAGLLTVGFAVRAGFRAADAPRVYKVFIPWTDLALAMRSMLEFRSATNMKMSAFIRLLEAHTDITSAETIDVETLVEWMGEERGVGTWKFLTKWKTYRLGKPWVEADSVVPAAILNSIEVKAVLNADEPLRSPLLRGHV